METISLELTEAEHLLVKFILQAVSHSKRNTIVRIAGGWVRDKILRLANDDIDLATDDMLGEDFASLLNEYLAHLGLETKTVAIIQANPDQSKHLVTANIHLDLSGFRTQEHPNATDAPAGAFKYDLDCVNLRAETYADNSRIPTMRFGTALEDALRRDFTINALFYNCMTGHVEDLTGHGTADLAARLVRTPLPPSVTFLDDPLRILRAVRFASRLDYCLHTDIGRTVCGQETVAAAFVCKVSKERVCKEIDGALSGKLNRPPLALWLMHRLGLLDKIFGVPSAEALVAENKLLRRCQAATDGDLRVTLDNWTLASWHTVYWSSLLLAVQTTAGCVSGGGATWDARIEQVRQLLSGTPVCAGAVAVEVALATVLGDLGGCLLRPSEYGTHRSLFWAAAASGLRSFELVEMPKKGKSSKALGLALTIMKQSLRMDNDTMNTVQVIFHCAPMLQAFSREVQVLLGTPGSPTPSLPAVADLRLRIGSLLRARAKDLWRMCLLFACAAEMAEESLAVPQSGPESTDADSLEFGSAQFLAWSERLVPGGVLSPRYRAIFFKYAGLQSCIENCLCLDGIWKMPFVYDGNALIRELGLKKGPQIGVLLDLQFQWLLSSQTSISSGSTDWTWFQVNSQFSEVDMSRCLQFMRTNL